MRSAIDLLPFGETILSGYFTRNLRSLESSLSRVIDSQNFLNEIQAAAVSADPDERYVLVGDAAGKTILWDRAANMTAELPTRAGRQRVSAVAINKTGALCASGDFDGIVTLWDLQSHQILRIHELSGLVVGLAFLGNGDRLLTGIVWSGRAEPAAVGCFSGRWKGNFNSKRQVTVRKRRENSSFHPLAIGSSP